MRLGKARCVGGLDLHYFEAGQGPLLILVHGFPDLPQAWHHQIRVLSQEGYHVVAPFMRGYGPTGGPSEPSAYSSSNLVGDLVDLVRAMGQEKAVLIGHDWGAAVCWQAALVRPDVFHAVMGMAVPFQPRREMGPPTQSMKHLASKYNQDELYLSAFARPDAHLPMDHDPETALRKMFWAFDGATSDAHQATGRIPEGRNFIDIISDEASLPPWMDREHFDLYVEAFSESGFERPVHWYRQIDDNWTHTRCLQGKKITVPAAFLVGERDPVRRYAGQHEAELSEWLEDFRCMTIVPGAGHWVQQENPEAVNAAILTFLWDLSLK